MALVRPNNQYIKVSEDGSWVEYASKESREHQKAAPSYDEVLLKYKELYEKSYTDFYVAIAQDGIDIEKYEDWPPFIADYPKYDGIYDYWQSIIEEENAYTRLYSLQKGCDREFPLAQPFFEVPIAWSIPNIVGSGQDFGFKGSLAEIYTKMKNQMSFGTTSDDL